MPSKDLERCLAVDVSVGAGLAVRWDRADGHMYACYDHQTL